MERLFEIDIRIFEMVFWINKQQKEKIKRNTVHWHIVRLL